MIEYKEFLKEAGVISEKDFYDVVNSLPDVDCSDIQVDPCYTQDELAFEIISAVLLDWSYVYADNVNFENKTFELDDVDSLKDLEEIKNTFALWTISNYDELAESISENESEKEEFSKLIKFIVNNASIEQLKDFAEEL